MFKWYDDLAGDVQSLLLNSSLKSESTNALSQFIFLFLGCASISPGFSYLLLKICYILTSVDTEVFLDNAAFYSTQSLGLFPFGNYRGGITNHLVCTGMALARNSVQESIQK